MQDPSDNPHEQMFDLEVTSPQESQEPVLVENTNTTAKSTPPQESQPQSAIQSNFIHAEPKFHIPCMQGNKYYIALAQIPTSLGTCENTLAFAQMSV